MFVALCDEQLLDIRYILIFSEIREMYADMKNADFFKKRKCSFYLENCWFLQ